MVFLGVKYCDICSSSAQSTCAVRKPGQLHRCGTEVGIRISFLSQLLCYVFENDHNKKLEAESSEELVRASSPQSTPLPVIQ